MLDGRGFFPPDKQYGGKKTVQTVSNGCEYRFLIQEANQRVIQARKEVQEQVPKQVAEKAIAKKLHKLGMPIENISAATGIPIKTLEEWLHGYQEPKIIVKLKKQ